MNDELGLFTGMLQVLHDNSAGWLDRVTGGVQYLFDRLLVIQLVITGIMFANGGGKIVEDTFKLSMRIGLLYLIITNYQDISIAIVDSLIGFGLLAGGGNVTVELMKNPSDIVNLGIYASKPLFMWMQNASLYDFAVNIIETIVIGLCALIIICCFFWIALQVFVTWVEFHLSSIMSFVLLGFSALKQTAWISEGSIKSPVMYGVKFATQAMVISLAYPLFTSIEIAENPTFGDALQAAFVSIVYLMLVMKSGSIAAGVVSGSPSLTAGDFAQASLTGAGIAAAGAMAVGGAAAAVTAAAAPVITAGAAGARTGAQLASSVSTATTAGGKAADVAGGAIKGGFAGAMQQMGTSSVAQGASALKERLGAGFAEAVQNGQYGAYSGTGGNPTEGMKSQQAEAGSGSAPVQPQGGKGFVSRAANAANVASRIIPSDNSHLNSAGKPSL